MSDIAKIGIGIVLVIVLCFWAGLVALAWTVIAMAAALGIAEGISYWQTNRSISQQTWSVVGWKKIVAILALFGMFVFLTGHLLLEW